MADVGICNFITRERALGIGDEEIRIILIKAGHAESVITEALTEAADAPSIRAHSMISLPSKKQISSLGQTVAEVLLLAEMLGLLVSLLPLSVALHNFFYPIYTGIDAGSVEADSYQHILDVAIYIVSDFYFALALPVMFLISISAARALMRRKQFAFAAILALATMCGGAVLTPPTLSQVTQVTIPLEWAQWLR